MICSCQNMTLSAIMVLKLHEVSLYIFISGLISTIILPVLFSSLFSRWWIISPVLLYTLLHSYLILSVRQFAWFFYLHFFSQCCYNLFSGTVFLWFSIMWLQSLFYHISFLSSTVYLSLLPLLYSLMIPKLYSYTSVLHIWQHVIFVLHFLLWLNSHLSLISFFCGHFLIFSRMGYR